ncbi:hypothetical protein A3J41_00655 [candidate division TM6 bacterium RIFCSPHIGHO2_12_FULL_38_8]|nr:MAG: hypothetical protein A3J41_00655 [candidate division TM6 bacterium RIFCSPHIGHO2_12_FULL_38_8]
MKENNSQEWLKFAKIDFEIAQDLLNLKDRYAGAAAYHAQQAAEKALKAYLMYQNEDIPKSHDLVLLVRRCAEFDLEFLLIELMAARLSPFSVQTRYPDDMCSDLSVQEAKKLLKDSEKILNFVIQKIQ